MPCRSELSRFIECPYMKMHFRRAFAFACQGGPASCAEPAQSAWRRIEFRYLPNGYCVRVALECHEYRDRCAAMLATALTMAPRDTDRSAGGDKSHRTAQAPTLNLVTHRAIPSPDFMITLYRATAISRSHLSGQPGGLPFGKTVREPTHLETVRTQRRDSFKRQNAIGASAVGNDLLPTG